MGKIMLLPLAIALAACASGPRVVDRTPDGISFRYQADELAEATTQAAEHCRRNGERAASLREIRRLEEDRLAVFICS